MAETTDEEQQFSVEQGFNIAMVFLLDLWSSLIEPELPSLEEDVALIHDFFFTTVCGGGDEESAEWNEAIFRVKNIPKTAQRKLRLSTKEYFLCTVEFVKLHNERYECKLQYVFDLLKSMQANPINHQLESSLWQDAITAVKEGRMGVPFNWNRNLP